MVSISQYYESDKSIWLFMACYRFNVFVINNRLIFLLIIYSIINLVYKYTISPTGKSDKNHNDKEDESKCVMRYLRK